VAVWFCTTCGEVQRAEHCPTHGADPVFDAEDPRTWDLVSRALERRRAKWAWLGGAAGLVATVAWGAAVAVALGLAANGAAGALGGGYLVAMVATGGATLGGWDLPDTRRGLNGAERLVEAVEHLERSDRVAEVLVVVWPAVWGSRIGARVGRRRHPWPAPSALHGA
jgi:hypothetical protein